MPPWLTFYEKKCRSGDVRKFAPHVFVERCGWFIRNLHSLFDYMVTSPRQDGNCGKTVQGWTKKNSEGDVIGGIPPTLEAIKTSPEKAYTFAKYLFSR